MPFYTGSTRDQRPADRYPLSVLIFGTATDGTVGESRWFEDAEQAAFAYGGSAVALFNPLPTDTSVTFPTTFVPDDPTLTLDSRLLLYHVNPSTGQPVRYPGLGNQTASGRPVVMTFDPIGYDPSVKIYDGGLWLQVSGYANHGLNGDLLLPLMSALSEVGDGGGKLLNVGGCRVGGSWLPSQPAAITVSLSAGPLTLENEQGPFDILQPGGTPGDATDSKTQTVRAGLRLACLGQGDGTMTDPYQTVTLTISGTGIVINPGLLGLPYTRHTYLFTQYPTWNDLWDAIQADYTAGVQPMRITSRIPRNDFRATSVPRASTADTNVPAVHPAVYSDLGLGQPDMTTAAGWLVALAENDLPLDECPFLVFAGLTGQAMAYDPESASALLTILDRNADGSDENPDLMLILPWSLTPPVVGVPYNAAADADAMFNFVDAIGLQLASRLLIVWGGMAQTSLPPALDGTPLAMPVAYAAAGAFVRESATTAGDSNVLHPIIQSAVTSYVPPLLIKVASEAPTPALPTSIPSPTDLETLRVSGLTALTRSVGDRWCLHSPILLANRDPLRFTLCESVIRERIQSALDQYLGENNTSATRARMSKTLTDLVFSVQNQGDSITRQISDFALELMPGSVKETQLITSLSVEGRMALYGETSSISFQVGLRS